MSEVKSLSGGKNNPEKKELPTDNENIFNNVNLKKGIQLFEESNYTEAIEFFSLVLGKGENAIARQYIGRSYFRLEQYKAAYRHFERLANFEKSKEFTNYAMSMIATILSIQGKYKESLKILKSLPLTATNLISQLFIFYYIYKIYRFDWILEEALKLMKSVSSFELKDSLKTKYHLAVGMVRQAMKEYSLAKHQYEKSLNYAITDLDRAKTLDELGSLYIDLNDLSKAEKILGEVKSTLANTNCLEKGINYKLLGILERKKENYHKAKEYLTEALEILQEKETYFEAAEVYCLLLNVQKSDEYITVDYYAYAKYYESKMKEVNRENEKIIDIIDNNFDDLFSN